MNILQIYNKVPYPSKDGGSIAVFNFSSGFVKQGHNVEILALNTNKHYISKSLHLKCLPNIRIESIYLNIEINLFKLLKNFFFSKLPYNAERFISKDFALALKNKIIKKKFDGIQVVGLYLIEYRRFDFKFIYM